MAPSVRRLVARLTERPYGLAVFLGLAAASITVVRGWDALTVDATGASLSMSGLEILLAGFAVGVIYRRRATSSYQAGAVAGLVASIVVVLAFVAKSATVVGSDSTLWLVLVAYLGTAAVLVFGTLTTVVIAMVGAVVGRWGSEITVRLLGGRTSA